jgi:hypothetical protein
MLSPITDDDLEAYKYTFVKPGKQCCQYNELHGTYGHVVQVWIGNLVYATLQTGSYK